MKSSLRIFLVFLLLATGSMLSVSCGFHLRESEKLSMPFPVSVLQVKVESSRQQYDPLREAVVNALNAQTDVTVQDSGDAPQLVLFNEKFDSRVISITATGKAEEYLLKYEVSFRLVNQDSKLLSEPQTVMVHRDHQFDRLNLLAKERERQERWELMRLDAVQQVLWRLSRIQIVTDDADKH